jgi:UDPglucose 6-dehydrogenase
MKVSVFGAGYVGLVTAACLAEMGNSVCCVDVDEARVRQLQQGLIPIHEPGLDHLVQRNAAAGRLSFSTDQAQAVAHGTILFIAVGTPAGEDGSADVRHVMTVARSIGREMAEYKVVVNKSTVPVGTADAVHSVLREALQERGVIVPFSVVSNPEFLKEGAAIADFMRPDRVVLGCSSDQAEFIMRGLYAPFLRNRERIQVMDVRSAELTKYVANAMLAQRISFMNEMAGLAERLGADIEKVRIGVGSDERIGPHFLYAGCGWGGSCFPKDVRALVSMGQDQGLDMGMVKASMQVNERQKHRLMGMLKEALGPHLKGRTVAVWGLAFKPETDDMREAPSRVLIDALVAEGATVQAYDPVAHENAAQIWQGQPLVQLAPSAMQACNGADALVVVTEWREFRSPVFEELAQRLSGRVVIDGRNLYRGEELAAAGLRHWSIGRPAVAAAAPHVPATMNWPVAA